jgi:hypothetical protein
MAVGWKGERRSSREAAMRIGDYPASGAPYWLTMTGVAALGAVGVVLMIGVQ